MKNVLSMSPSSVLRIINASANLDDSGVIKMFESVHNGDNHTDLYPEELEDIVNSILGAILD